MEHPLRCGANVTAWSSSRLAGLQEPGELLLLGLDDRDALKLVASDVVPAVA